jgi:hypothetical protein
MKPKKHRQAIKVIVIDESNSVVDNVRGPASEFMRKAIRDRLEKDKKLMELKEKHYGKSKEARNGEQMDGNVQRID